MISIAACDDEEQILKQLNQYIVKYNKTRNLVLKQMLFKNEKELLDFNLSNIDILLLDIQLRETNGLQIAKKLRETNQEILIIFITNFVQYAIDGYEVKAFNFLKKPITYERFQDVIDDAVSKVSQRKADFITVNSVSGVRKVLTNDIIYCETYKGHVLMHIKNRETIESYSSMGKTEKLLTEKNFFRCHTAFLINFFYIKNILQKDLILEDDTCIPISKYRKKSLLNAITNYWGDEFL